MKTRGFYPNTSFSNKDTLYYTDKRSEWVYSAVRYNNQDEQYRKSDLGWAYPSELRLWSTLALSIPEGEGKIILYPYDQPILIKDKDFTLDISNDDRFIKFVNKLLYEKIEGISPYFNRKHYDFHHYDFDKTLQESIYSQISLDDQLLLRGLSCLIKSSLLMGNYLFSEEAAILIFISLEAALTIINNRLIESGLQNPNYDDIYAYVHNNVNEYFPSYYQECYENRILLIHPENKYGLNSIPPLEADDYFDTYDSLISFYRFILLGEKPSYD